MSDLDKELDNVLKKLSFGDQEVLSKAAIIAANSLGYCDETRNVLESLGFPTDDLKNNVEITVKFNLIVPLGVEVDVHNFVYDNYEGVEMESVEQL